MESVVKLRRLNLEISKRIVTDQPTLRQQSKKVDRRHNLTELVAAMAKQMAVKYDGERPVGLSAIQIGVPLQVIAIQVGPIEFIVNPVITKPRGHQVREETCLSLPGVAVMVRRPQIITVKGLNQYLKPIKHKMHGLQARIVCHEVDHLYGVLIMDHRQ